MAKELPYFKFEPSEWENGLIQMCSRESKGLFVDIISIYWQRLGDLPYRFVMQKLCGGNANALQELIKEEIIKVDDDKIVVSFLDSQLKEFNLKSNKASESAKARWKKEAENQEVNANALQTESERNARREDKRIKDEIILNNSEELKKEINNYKTIYGEEIISEFTDYWFSVDTKKRTKKLRIELQAKFDVKKRLNTWVNKKNDIHIKNLSVILLNTETYKSNFHTIYKGLDYKQELTKFYQHRMKQAKLTDSVNEYASHFFNYLKSKQ